MAEADLCRSCTQQVGWSQELRKMLNIGGRK
jgi:hypothetical protein